MNTYYPVLQLIGGERGWKTIGSINILAPTFNVERTLLQRTWETQNINTRNTKH